MRDVLPDEVALRDWAMAQILAVRRRHGFVRIETPAVESLRLLLRSDGGENEKLIFKILKRGEKLQAAGRPDDMADLGLRFDLTVPLVRYYAHNHARLPQPLKAIQIGPVWRGGRRQPGRDRPVPPGAPPRLAGGAAAGASGSRSTRRWCGGWATTPGPSSRSSTATPPRRSRAAGATIGWSASSSAGTSRPPASRSASSG